MDLPTALLHPIALRVLESYLLDLTIDTDANREWIIGVLDVLAEEGKYPDPQVALRELFGELIDSPRFPDSVIPDMQKRFRTLTDDEQAILRNFAKGQDMPTEDRALAKTILNDELYGDMDLFRKLFP